MKKVRVGIIGATGYTGMELLRLLLQHPSVEITLATSEKFAGKRVDQAFPYLSGRTNLILQGLSDDAVAASCDLAFSCLPHHEAMTHVAAWIRKGLKVVDLSADFRLRSAQVYEKWYGPHSAADLLATAVYGLPELNRNVIKSASLIGNPGCYPTGTILALTPFLKAKVIDPTSIIVDAKSGVTGAGRSSAVESLFCEVNDSVHAYKVGNHRHTPEIEQALSIAAGQEVIINFTPHLIPMDRGILSTMYAKTIKPLDTKGALQILSHAYKNEPFVRVLPEGVLPKTKNVRGTNMCELSAVHDPRTGRLILISAIDNLLKGASSQAVQNMNLMLGLDETTGLTQLPLVP